MQKSNVLSSFKSWKIWLALILGLSFSFYLLYQNLSETHFIETKIGEGTHTWTDYNKNNKIDYTLEKEFILTKNGSFKIKKTFDYLNEISFTKQTVFYLLLALIFVVGRDLAYMWRIKILTKDKLNWNKSFYVILLWEFASALSPGIVGGSAVAMFILNREKISLGKSTSIVVITALMDNLFYVIMIPFVFLFISSSDLFPSSNAYKNEVSFIFWTGYSIICLICLLLYLSIFFFPTMIKNMLSFLFSLPFLKKWKKNALATGEEIIITSKAFKNEKMKFWMKSFVATFLSWTSRYLVINCVIAAFLNITFFQHFYILGKQLVLWLFLLISPTPGASGVAEYAFSELMTGLGASVFLLTSMAIIWRLISYFPYLIIGSIILPKWLKKTNKNEITT